jgi:hypothetical protein
MVKKEQLFVLIRSLSKAEKRYFKLFCKQTTTESNYLKLFEAMDLQKEYDEKAIKKKFANQEFCKQLHVTKNYLRQLILKSLRNYHHGISRNAELKDALRNVEILYHKELYPHCQIELKKAEGLARSFEINTGLVEVISWKRKLEQIMHSQNYPAFIELLSEQERTINSISNANLHWQYAVQTSGAVISNKPVSKKSFKKSKLVSLRNAQTLESKVLYFNTSYLTFLRNGMHDKAEKSLVDLLDLLTKFPHRIKEDPTLYISSANNLVSFYIFKKEYGKAIDMIDRSRAFYEKAILQHEKKTMLKQLLRTYNIELEIYRDTKTFEKNLSFIYNIESFIIRHKSKIPPDYQLSFWFQLANIHFVRKDFDRSLKWINQIINLKSQNVRMDLQIQARMLNLMIHFEQDSLFVLRYFVDSTRRFLKKINDVQLFEQTLLAFFAKIGDIPKFEQKDKFRELYQFLFSQKTEIIPAAILDYIDYKSWIEGKLIR